MMINGQREKNVRAAKPLAVFARLAFTSPGKKCDKQLTHIVRVISRFLENSLSVLSLSSLSSFLFYY
jgi:hypothetical protein